jgi:hypothetical protein
MGDTGWKMWDVRCEEEDERCRMYGAFSGLILIGVSLSQRVPHVIVRI